MLRIRTLLAAVVLATVAVLVPASARGQTVERIDAYDVRIEIERSGALSITETIDYDFGVSERHGIFRDILDRLRYDDTTIAPTRSTSSR